MAHATLAADKRRLQRQRSAQKLSRLRAQLAAWARVALALRVLDDADAIWDAFLDADVRATRAQLRNWASAVRDAHALAADRAALLALLAEHELATRAIAAAVATAADDDWVLRVQRWRALARIHFRAWTAAQCAREIEAALRVLRDRDDVAQTTTTATRSSGLALLGWRDSVTAVRAGRELHFSLHKTFEALDLAHFVATTERIFTDSALYASVVHGGHARASVDVLQRLSDHVAVVLYHEAYADAGDAAVHALSLNARVTRADGSVVQLYWPIDTPAIVNTFTGPCDGWMRHFHYAVFEPRGDAAVRVAVRGVLSGEPGLSLARYWQFRVLESLVRIEARAARRGLLQF